MENEGAPARRRPRRSVITAAAVVAVLVCATVVVCTAAVAGLRSGPAGGDAVAVARWPPS